MARTCTKRRAEEEQPVRLILTREGASQELQRLGAKEISTGRSGRLKAENRPWDLVVGGVVALLREA